MSRTQRARKSATTVIRPPIVPMANSSFMGTDQAALRRCDRNVGSALPGSSEKEAHTAMPHVNSMSPINAMAAYMVVPSFLRIQSGTGARSPGASGHYHPIFTGACCLMNEMIG